jgi:hypothetical protein
MTKPKPTDVSESETAIAKSVDLEPRNTEKTPGLPNQQNDRQTAGDIAQRRVGDRGVEHDHERGDGDDDGDQPRTAMLADTFAPENNVAEQLDEEEAEFRSIRRDLPGAKGASAAGIVTISVGKTPAKNEFFRTHLQFRPIVPIVDLEVGMEKQFFAVTSTMVEALNGIGITVTDHVLYRTITSRGATRIVPVRQAGGDGEQNEYNRTKEIGLVQGMDEWVRLFTDHENHCYKVFPAPAGRFSEPQWPELKDAKIFKLAFRDKGRLVDSTEHPLFKKWAARDSD